MATTQYIYLNKSYFSEKYFNILYFTANLLDYFFQLEKASRGHYSYGEKQWLIKSVSNESMYFLQNGYLHVHLANENNSFAKFSNPLTNIRSKLESKSNSETP